MLVKLFAGWGKLGTANGVAVPESVYVLRGRYARTTGCFRSALPSSIMEALVCPLPLPLCIFLDVHGQLWHSFQGHSPSGGLLNVISMWQHAQAQPSG